MWRGGNLGYRYLWFLLDLEDFLFLREGRADFLRGALPIMLIDCIFGTRLFII